MSTDIAYTSLSTWSDAWIDALSSFSHPGRMRRGRQFAEQNRIRKLDVKPGEISALVKDGSHTYETTIQIQPLDDAAWDQIIGQLASQALYSARLLSGEIPPEVIQVFEQAGVSLFPQADVLQASCTCPDWEVPCKHIAGLYYLLADKFEEDPFLLFLLRGRSKQELLAALRQNRQSSGDITDTPEFETFETPPLSENLDNFWDIGPELNDISFHITRPTTSLPHLKRLGPPPFTPLDLVTILSPIYEKVTEAALECAYQESGQRT